MCDRTTQRTPQQVVLSIYTAPANKHSLQQHPEPEISTTRPQTQHTVTMAPKPSPAAGADRPTTAGKTVPAGRGRGRGAGTSGTPGASTAGATRDLRSTTASPTTTTAPPRVTEHRSSCCRHLIKFRITNEHTRCFFAPSRLPPPPPL
jgi:hypothetical protein